jgi:hypothetical protein
MLHSSPFLHFVVQFANRYHARGAVKRVLGSLPGWNASPQLAWRSPARNASPAWNLRLELSIVEAPVLAKYLEQCLARLRPGFLAIDFPIPVRIGGIKARLNDREIFRLIECTVIIRIVRMNLSGG